MLNSLLLTLCLVACADDGIISSTPSHEIDSNTSNITWWQEARFGLFIHYGVYSALAGEYIGPDIYGNNINFQTLSSNNTPEATKLGGGAGAEWIMKEALIPRDIYKSYATGFTASDFDPEYIATLAKNAGMGYIVLTSKHHEGFCLWDSKTTDWDIVNTPAGDKWNNDLIAPMAKATRDAGLKFGLYFSQFRDWMYDGAPETIPEMVEGGSYSLEQQKAYMQNYTYPMIEELLEQYKPSIFWWDGSYNGNKEFASRCDSIVRSKSFNILQNDRLSPQIGYKGDFETPEQSINEDLVKENSELCMTINGTWGYSKFDTSWKESAFVLYTLLRVQKLGCNLLLNIGPKADGSIPAESVKVLEDLAYWMNDNSVSAHRTIKSPFCYNLPYGPSTYRKLNGKTHLYYHVFYWDKSGELWIPGIMNPDNDIDASLLSAQDIKLRVESIEGFGLKISGLPESAPNKLCSTIDIAFSSCPVLEEGFRFIDDTLYLDALAAKFTGNYYIGDWENKPALFWYSGRPVKYKLVIPENGRYGIAAELAAFFNGSVSFRFDKITGEIESHVLTGYNSVTPNGHANFEWQDMGEIYLSAGTYEVTIESKQQDSWLKLRQFRITAL